MAGNAKRRGAAALLLVLFRLLLCELTFVVILHAAGILRGRLRVLLHCLVAPTAHVRTNVSPEGQLAVSSTSRNGPKTSKRMN